MYGFLGADLTNYILQQQMQARMEEAKRTQRTTQIVLRYMLATLDMR